jgi:putative ABC transport system permease protein
MRLQMIDVTAVNLRSIGQRLGPSAAAVFGIAGVVVVVVTLLSIVEGLRTVMQRAGDANAVLVMRAGSDTEMTSGFYLHHVRAIEDAPGIARGDGAALASPELLVVVNAPLRRSGIDADVPLRGVLPVAFKVHDRLKITAGRAFVAGSNEIIVGRDALQQYAGLELGSSVRWGEGAWRVVGIFEDGDSVTEGEIWCDAIVAQPVFHRPNTYQSVAIKLASPDRFQTLKDALLSDPRLSVKVMRKADYYLEQSQALQGLIRVVALVFGGLMGLGAAFAAVNTMYSAVADRMREIATLRALGFSGVAVATSVLAEAVLLSLLGGVLGAGVAWAVFDGWQTSTMNIQSLSQVSFVFAVTPRVLAQGVLVAIVLGLMGGLMPAYRAATLPVVAALREP